MSSRVVSSFPLEEEYKKGTGISPADIAKLRQWLLTQPHLPNEHITDLDLILSFHSCKRCMETTKKVIDTHYTLKTQFNTIFKHRYYDERIETVLNRILLKPLPSRTKDGAAILYSSILDTDTKNFMLIESLRAVMMLLELWQYEEGTWPGLIIVYDLTGLKFGHIFKMDMDAVRQFLVFLEQAMFVKIKSVHCVNAPYFMDYFMAVVKRFVRSELLDIFTVHLKGSNTLEQYIDMAVLPKEAGGNYKCYRECKEDTLSMMRAGKEFFVMENKKRIDESLRPNAKSPPATAKKLPKKQNITP